MSSVVDFLKRASDRNGFSRDRFEERKVPNDFSSICILPFFGDFRSLFILSSFILPRYRKEIKSSKYFVMASWPGYQSIFPSVDEYWSINDFSQIKRFYEGSEGFSNKSDMNTIFLRNFNEFFRDVIDTKDFSYYYRNGLTSKFFDKFKNVERFLPFVASSAFLGKDFLRDLSTYPGYKVFINPSLFFTRWVNGKAENTPVSKEFWEELVSYLTANNCTPVIWQNYLSYNLQEREDFRGKCIFFLENDISKVLAAMRSTGLVLDIFGYLSYFSLISRCPYLAIDDRPRYHIQKDYELEDLFPLVQNKHIFTFSTILINGNPFNWKNDLFKVILSNIEKFLPEIDRDSLPSTGESIEVVPYDKVREVKLRKLGTRLLQVPKE
jgi:hypothetical protein